MQRAQPSPSSRGGIDPGCDRPLSPVRAIARLGWRVALAVFLGLAGSGLPYLVAPPVATAYTSRLNIFLIREAGESFDSFLQRSEIVARAAVQRSFDADPEMTDVIVTMVGNSQNISIPLLTVSVSRNNWRLKPDVSSWATYYEGARNLMP
ncbi:MAG TPA: hypothetical protein IGR64_08200 [Leptolyngbyaceae cyanobacterium M65_K2018_010]|nr:hypothetical protein [Leptolyngbyaceae cyanobacterium M65_K2018_010]